MASTSVNMYGRKKDRECVHSIRDLASLVLDYTSVMQLGGNLLGCTLPYWILCSVCL